MLIKNFNMAKRDNSSLSIYFNENCNHSLDKSLIYRHLITVCRHCVFNKTGTGTYSVNLLLLLVTCVDST